MKKPTIIFAIVIVIIAAAAFYLNRHAPGLNLTNNQSGGSSDSSKLGDYGAAPEFTGIDNWINSPPLTIASLQGKVVLVDFWTFSCINCIRTLPYVTKWYNTYKNQGLVVVGVHTPEFAFEKDTANVTQAVKQFGIAYPVAQDNEYGTWNAYSNQYWPAEYLINQKGEIVYQDFGEGNYQNMENAIRQLLGLAPGATVDAGPDLSQIGSPEMYFGTARLQYLATVQEPSAGGQNYTLPQSVALNNFAVGGSWQFNADNATLTKPNGQIELKFHSAKLDMVAASTTPQTVTITVDGKPQPSVTISASKLYNLFDSSDYSDHVIIITIPNPGLQAFTFTFG